MILIYCLLILLVILLILYINYIIFEKKSNQKETEISLKTDTIVILSKYGCPFCEKLDEKIINSDAKYTKILHNIDNTFTFDEKFSSLEKEERTEIIQELAKISSSGNLFFPTIINQDKLYVGMPEDNEINKIFKL